MDAIAMVEVWKSILGQGWLGLGNGWRNLYLLSCMAQAGALGLLFARMGWFTKKSRAACFLAGAAATPLVQYLWMLLMAFLWPQAPRLLLIGFLPGAAGLFLLGMLLRYFRRIPGLLRQGWAFAKRALVFDKPGLTALCLALAMGILLLPVCVRLSSSMNAANAGDSGEYMALALRYCEDRDVLALLEKEETVGHFRGHSHFPSLELYMSYGLMHTGGEYGYPNDKPMLSSVGLLTFYMLAAFLALLLVLTGERRRWVLLGLLLLNLVPNLYYSVNGAPRDIWRILALFLAMLFFTGLSPRGGGFKRYAVKLLAAFALCFTVMSAHVVCFVVLPFVVAAFVLARWYGALLRGREAGKELTASVGIALSGALGTLLGFSGNLWCYWKWGQMSPWRLMTTYVSAPWYEGYMRQEYKLEQTTTHLDFWKARYDVVMAYATPIGIWGMRLAALALLGGLLALLWKRFYGQKGLAREGGFGPILPLVTAALLTLCTLAPMTGLLDTRIYSFSGSFLTLQRYTLQWYMLAAVMIAAVGAAIEGIWPRLCEWILPKWGRLNGWMREGLVRLPAFLCALLCVLAFSQGTKQTGYANSFYRHSRNVMEDEGTLLDTGYLSRYGLLMTAQGLVPEGAKTLITRVGYQYAIRGQGYLLTSNPIVPLMNLPEAELPQALAQLSVAMIATEPDFWDERYYADSALNAYLSRLPEEQVFQDGKYMRLYVLDAGLAQSLAQALAAKGGVLSPAH